MGVHLCRPEALVTEKFLNDAKVRAAVKEVCCKGVSQGVRMESGRESRALRHRFESRACAAFAKWRTVPIEKERS